MNEYQTSSYWIGKFTDNELTSEEEEQILSQASHNPVLRNELRLDRDITDLFDDNDRLKLSEQIKRTIKEEKGKIRIPFYFRIAASILVLLTLAGVSFALLRHNYVTYGNVFNVARPFSVQKIKGLLGFVNEKSDLKSTPPRRRQLALNNSLNDTYTPRPEYEYLVGTVTRDLSIIVISPGPRINCKSDSLLQFSWRWLSGMVPVNIEISDNRGRVILRNLQTNDVNYVLNTKILSKGLYYYKIISGEDLVTMGSVSIY